MPIYEYACQNCGKITEALQKMQDPPLTDCAICGQSRLTKLVSKTSFQLKGSGWYATDFKDKTPANSAATTDEKKPEDNSKTEGKCDNNPSACAGSCAASATEATTD